MRCSQLRAILNRIPSPSKIETVIEGGGRPRNGVWGHQPPSVFEIIFQKNKESIIPAMQT